MKTRWRRAALLTAAVVAALAVVIGLVVAMVGTSADGGNDAATPTTTTVAVSASDPPSVGPGELKVVPINGSTSELRGERPTEPGPATEPSKVWSADIGCDDQTCDLTADQQQAYLLTRLEDFGGRIAAYDGASGEVRWTNEDLYNPADLHLTAAGLLVEHDHDLSMLSTVDGSVLWSKASTTFEGFVGDDAGLLLVNDQTGDGPSPTVLRPDGEELWSLAGKDVVFMTACEGAVIAQGFDGLRVFDAESGKERWSQDGAALQTSCGDELIAVGSTTGTRELHDAETGKALGPLAQVGELQLTGDRVVSSSGRAVTSFHATDPRGGQWTSKRPDGTYGNAYRAGDTLVQIDFTTGLAVAFGLPDGDTTDAVSVGDQPHLRLTTALLLSATDDGVAAFDVETLEPQWTVDLAGARLAAPGGTRLFAVTEDTFVAYAA